jgi:D-sedoheptulose 7-phosphate isomerase
MIGDSKVQKFTVESYISDLQALFSAEMLESWNSALERLNVAWSNESEVYVAGNGGNHLNSLHFATDWNKGVQILTGKSLKTHVYGENSGLASAVENDHPHGDGVIKYFEYIGRPSRVFVLLTAGGTSRNILNAAEYAQKNNIETIGLTGGARNLSKSHFDINLHVPTDDIQLVEDIHAMFGHTVLKSIIQYSDSLTLKIPTH